MRRLTEEEKIWRVNYYYRAAYSVIPRRKGMTDGSAEHMMIFAYDFFDFIRERDGYWNVLEDYLDLETGIIGTQVYRLYRLPSLTIEEYERKRAEQPLSEKEEWLCWLPEGYNPVHIYNPCYPHVKELLQQTVLTQPPSERALPRPVPMNQIDIDRWLKRCPEYMDTYKHQLVKVKEEKVRV